MMLTKTIENSIDIKGVRVDLTLAFNNILKFYELQEDERFNDKEKIDLGFDLICSCKKKLTDVEKVEIIKYIFKNHVNVVKLKGEKEDSKKVFDFKQDHGYIYASFMKEYSIDLNDQIDLLDWRKFIWLFHGLSNNSKIKEIINIRAKDIPKRTKHNNKEIENLIKLKARYALEISDEERRKNLADSLKKIVKRFI